MWAIKAICLRRSGHEVEKGECTQLLRCSGLRSEVFTVDTPGKVVSKYFWAQFTQQRGSDFLDNHRTDELQHSVSRSGSFLDTP